MNAGFVSSVRVARAGVALSFLVVVAAVAACGDNGSTDPNKARAVSAVSPESVSTAAGVKMSQPIVVLVTGGSGTPLQNVPVEWSIGVGGGTLSDSVSNTDAAGHAQTTYTPGTLPAIASVLAEAAGLKRLTFRVVLVAGPPASLQKFGFADPAAVVGSALTMKVKLVDQFGNFISGKVVNWSAANGSISATTSTTDNIGVATVTYTLGAQPGTYSLTATAEGVAPAVFAVKAVP